MKILIKFLELARSKESAIGYSFLDPLLLVELRKHPSGVSKADLMEILLGDRSASKSIFDAPLNRLIDEGFVDTEVNEKAATKAGAGKIFYKLSEKGKNMIRG